MAYSFSGTKTICLTTVLVASLARREGKNFMVYGTPDGVVSFAEQHPEVQGASAIWVATKPNAEISAQVFKNSLPEDFRDSVHQDLIAIGFLADRAGGNADPNAKEQARAKAALDDLTFKTQWIAANNLTATPTSLVKVTVHTKRSGVETKHWTVWFVRAGWEGEKNSTYAFEKESSPTVRDMVPGPYTMWASHKNKRGERKQVLVGDDFKQTKDVDLEIP